MASSAFEPLGYAGLLKAGRIMSRVLKPGEQGRVARKQELARFVAHRRRVAELSLAATGAMGVIALYQTGVLKHIPEPRIPGFNADKVAGSAEAYSILGIPDGLLGMGSYAVTAALATIGASDRTIERPALSLLMAAKVGVDTAFAAKSVRDQWKKQHAFCSWCLLACAVTFAAVPLVIPETRAATRQMARRCSVRLRA